MYLSILSQELKAGGVLLDGHSAKSVRVSDLIFCNEQMEISRYNLFV